MLMALGVGLRSIVPAGVSGSYIEKGDTGSAATAIHGFMEYGQRSCHHHCISTSHSDEVLGFCLQALAGSIPELSVLPLSRLQSVV